MSFKDKLVDEIGALLQVGLYFTICLGGALLSYNVLWAIRRNLGPGGIIRLLQEPIPTDGAAAERA